MGLLRTITPYSPKKIHFFTRVVDLAILVDLKDLYDQPWSTQWIKTMAENTVNNTPIMSLQHGDSHTLAVNSRGKVFTWGWNDSGHCGKPESET